MKIVTVLLLSLFVLSCGQQQSQQLPESDVIANVGDEVITADLLNAYMHVNGIANPTPEVVNASLTQLIEEIAMANIATKKQLPMTREQMNNFKYLQLRALASNAKNDYLTNNVITEEEIKQEYNKVNEATKGQEYHVHHMLYTDEIEAITVLDEINSVDDFLKAENQYLKDNPDKVNVGNLGWVNLLQLPQSFKDILPSMSPNSINPQVISSQFGAHIVYLEATRDIVAPAFEEVKAGIENSLKSKKASKFGQLAVAKARVTIVK
ncbi:MAG: peptidyl-prolyl cis-trans isomerase [Marinicellaceae bacterium]